MCRASPVTRMVGTFSAFSGESVAMTPAHPKVLATLREKGGAENRQGRVAARGPTAEMRAGFGPPWLVACKCAVGLLLGMASLLWSGEGSASVGGLRFFAMDALHAKADFGTLRAVDTAGNWSFAVQGARSQASVNWKPDTAQVAEWNWHRSPWQVDIGYGLGKWRGMLAVSSDVRDAHSLAVAGAYGGTRLVWRQGEWSPLSVSVYDPGFPDSLPVAGFWRTQYRRVALEQSLQWGAWQVQGMASYTWTRTLAPDSGYSLRDSTNLAHWHVHLQRAWGRWRYGSSLDGIGVFSQWQGLRADSNDVKRFSLLRMGGDAWQWRHRLESSAMRYTLLLGWYRMKFFPTSHWPAGESLSGNRLFSPDLYGVIGHSLYRKSYRLEGRGTLWLAGLGSELAPPSLAWKNWQPTFALQGWLPWLQSGLRLEEHTDMLVYGTEKQYSGQGDVLALAGLLQIGAQYAPQPGWSLQVLARQWVPYILHNSACESCGDSDANSPGESSSRRQWRFGRDGLAWQLMLRLPLL